MATSTVLSVISCLAVTLIVHTDYNVLASRVPASPLLLPYHNGPLLSGPEPIRLFITFYGDFEASERYILKAFLSSLTPTSLPERRSLRGSPIAAPSVSKWWSLTQRYCDIKGRFVSQTVQICGERNDSYSLGRHLRASDAASLAARTSAEFSLSDEGKNVLVLVLTSADVYVEGFCMHACGSHSATSIDDVLKNPGWRRRNSANGRVPYAWVGDSKMQCPGYCAWPFERPQYGPPMEPLKAPNSVGIDGMIISLAKLLAGVATNPFGDAFYQGDDATFGPEAGSVCSGIFGPGAYPGFPGELLQDVHTGASFNVEGIDGVKFLVPWIWDPALQACAGQA